MSQTEVESLVSWLRAHPIFGSPSLDFQARALGDRALGWREDSTTPGPYLEVDRRAVLMFLDDSGGRGDYAVALDPGRRGGGTRQDVAAVGLAGPYGRRVLLHELAHLVGGLDEGYEGEGARVHAAGRSCLMAEKAATEFCADCARALRLALDGAANRPKMR